MDKEKVLTELREADMALVGLGEDFNDTGRLRSCERYVEGKKYLQERECHSFVPAWREYCSEKMPDILSPALKNLEKLLDGKNYFVVSVATDKRILQSVRTRERLVMPCGTTQYKQCSSGCPDMILELTEADKAALANFFDKLYDGQSFPETPSILGSCPNCHAAMVLNNIYAEKYDEQGYLPQWEKYTKWLQGTLNHKLAVLELGVGMQFPSVIRWPFEKAAYFNRKASFIRVHETLYQLTEELSGKGCGISQNAIEWLENL